MIRGDKVLMYTVFIYIHNIWQYFVPFLCGFIVKYIHFTIVLPFSLAMYYVNFSICM